MQKRYSLSCEFAERQSEAKYTYRAYLSRELIAKDRPYNAHSFNSGILGKPLYSSLSAFRL